MYTDNRLEERYLQFNVAEDIIKPLMAVENISVSVLSEISGVDSVRLALFFDGIDELKLEEFNEVLNVLKLEPFYLTRPKRYPSSIGWPKENSLNHLKGLR